MSLSPVTLVVLATLSKLMVFATVSLWPSPPIPSFLLSQLGRSNP